MRDWSSDVCSSDREKAPRTLTALAQQLDMPKSSAFNLIQTLLDRGFIYETRKRGGYYPTRRLLELASRIAEGDPFLQNIHGYLESQIGRASCRERVGPTV